MTDPVSEPVHEPGDELWADGELSDEALDRTAAQPGKLSINPPYVSLGPYKCKGGKP